MRKLFRFIFFIFLLTACTSTVPPQSPTPTAVISSTPTTPRAIRNSELPVSTKTDWYQSTPTITPALNQVENKFTKRCVKIEAFTSMPDGFIVLRKDWNNKIHLLDLSNKEDILVGNGYYGFGISPDFTRLAMIDSNRHLIILDSQQKKYKVTSVPSTWSGIIMWVDQNNILVNQYQDSNNKNIPTSSVLFNPLTGDKREYKPDYPNMPKLILAPFRLWDHYSNSLVVYDDQFIRAIYPAFDNNDAMFVLWDIENQKEIKRFYVDGIGNTKGAPRWKRNGTSFVIGLDPQKKKFDQTGVYYNIDDELPYKGGSDLFEVSRDGEIKRLTYLSTQYFADEKAFSLSPDGNQVAFWNAQGDTSQLAILDIASGNIKNLCLETGINVYSPIWSPDNKYLVVTLDNPQESYGTFLIDIQQELAIKITDGPANVAEGWLLNPQD